MITTVGLIGDPVAHSVSPAMHNAAFAHHGLRESYALWPTPAAELMSRVAALRESPVRGANVTIPHKTAVIPLVDELDPVAEAVGAVNTIVRATHGRLRGLNTDVAGFMRALRSTGFDPAGRSVVLLGAGGAARAVGYGLIAGGVDSLIIANRTVDRAESLLVDLLATTDRDPHLRALPIDDSLAAALDSCDALINATSVGLDGESLPLPAGWLPRGGLVVDLIYHTTPLLRAAAARGATTQDGLEMLVWQGALAFEAWTGLAAPVDTMRAAATRALKERT
jgi:shikimate dehydrogenase